MDSTTTKKENVVYVAFNTDDATLVERGIAAIVEHYSSYVGSIALRILGRPEDAEDVVQEVFFRAHLSLHNLENPNALRGWLRTITVRAAQKKLRKRRAKQFVGLDDSEDYRQLAASGATPEQKAFVGQVFSYLDDMPVKLRLPWTLRYVEGETFERVAELCDCSLNTAKRRIAKAHERLLKELRDGRT